MDVWEGYEREKKPEEGRVEEEWEYRVGYFRDREVLFVVQNRSVECRNWLELLNNMNQELFSMG